MLISAMEGLPELNASPLASVSCISPRVVVEVDDVDEERVRLVFSPYQAVRMLTADCFDLPDGMSIIPRTIMEIRGSDWLEKLRNTLKKSDCEADFMDKARHFLLPLGDDFLEIAAWGVEVEPV